MWGHQLVLTPLVMPHNQVRRQLGIDDTLVRLSVGIEALDDLVKDIGEALKVG